MESLNHSQKVQREAVKSFLVDSVGRSWNLHSCLYANVLGKAGVELVPPWTWDSWTR